MRWLHWLAAASLLAVVAPPPAAFAETRERVRLILLDKCVADEWKLRPIKGKIVDECKCASAKVARELGDGQVEAFNGVAPVDPRDYWRDATRTCFVTAVK